MTLAVPPVPSIRAAVASFVSVRAWFGRYGVLQRATLGLPVSPTLNLHGERDGVALAALAGPVSPMLCPDGDARILPGVGHFLHLEKPDVVDPLVCAFIGSPRR